jgi:hypothetical protein
MARTPGSPDANAGAAIRPGLRSGFDCRTPSLSLLSMAARWGETAMAKGQKRSNREPKKPKADKKKSSASAGTVSSVPAKPKPGSATAGSKK